MDQGKTYVNLKRASVQKIVVYTKLFEHVKKEKVGHQ